MHGSVKRNVMLLCSPFRTHCGCLQYKEWRIGTQKLCVANLELCEESNAIGQC